MRTIFRILAFMAIFTLLVGSSYAPVQADPTSPPNGNGGQTGPDGSTGLDPDWQMLRHSETGTVRFLSTKSGAAMPQPSFLEADATPEAAARNFLTAYGELFGLSDQANELTVLREQTLTEGKARSFVRFQQVYQGIPVFGGELIVQLDASNAVVSVNGEVLPDLQVSTNARVPADKAIQNAKEHLAKVYELDAGSLVASKPELWIYNPALLGAGGLRQNNLVWRLEVTHPERLDIRELVLADADLGGIALNFNQVDSAKYRLVYDNNNTITSLPGTLERVEGGPASGIADVNNAYNYAGSTYDYYRGNFGRDSIDGNGMEIVSTVRHCLPGWSCPLQNAFWNGSQMIYGQGYASADDVVGHELTHGVTEHESGLFYYMQSGAISEALSDIFGEFIDLGNGLGNDAPGVRWLLGEDIPGGAIRDMENPPAYGDPDKMTSGNYYCGPGDSGGVHTNSGVANKAAFLMVDGGLFNGYTVTGLGLTKAGKIWYEAATKFLTSGSDYMDLGSALHQACLSQVGNSGITLANCTEVQEAVQATEMHLQAASCTADEALMCNRSVINSSFNGTSGGWYAVTGNDWRTTSGNYLETNGGTNAWNSAATYDDYGDIDYTARIRRYGEDSSNGIIIRGKPEPTWGNGIWSEGYAFYYTRNGNFSVWREDNGGAIALAGWTASGAIVQGDNWNTLRVVANGSHLKYYINGTLVWQGIDSKYAHGKVGLLMYHGAGVGDLYQVDWAIASGGDPLMIFNETFENAASGNWVRGYYGSYTGAGFHWYYPQNANPYGFDPRYGTGSLNLWGYDLNLTADFFMRMTRNVALPAGKTAYLHFDHAYDFEQSFDGGVLEYSINGGSTWIDYQTGGLTAINGYNGTISNSTGNPLGGRNAFVQDTDGMSSSRISLAPLAGQNVRLQFRIGTDSTIDDLGWMVDNVKIYTCETQVEKIFLPLSFKSGGLPNTFHSNFNGVADNWSSHAGTWSVSPTYFTTPGQDTTWNTVSYPLSYTNVMVSARMLRNGDPLYANTIVVRGNPNPLGTQSIWDDGIVFNYSNDGRYWIFKMVNGSLSWFQLGTASPAILSSNEGGDEWNYMRVWASGATLRLYLNDQLVWEGVDPSPTSGRVGFGFYRPTGWNRLFVDWVTVVSLGATDTPEAFGLPTTISAEQQELNQNAPSFGDEATGR